MKIICNQQKIDEAINISKRAISRKTTLPILSGILLEAQNNQLKIIGNDLNMGIETTIAVDVVEPGSIVLDANLFSEIIRKLPAADITIELIDENNVLIACENSKFELVGKSAEEYPELPDVKKENTYELNSNLMKNMIKQTSFAISTDESRPILTGVLFQVDNNNLTLVALDGYRLAYREAKINNANENKAVIPGSTLNEVSKILEGNNNFTIAFTDKHVLFTIDNVKIISRLLEGEFINYNQIIPDNFKSEMVIDTNKFKNAIERALLLAQQSKDSSIKFEIMNKKLVITSNAEKGSMNENIDIKYSGNDLKIGFNPRYILDVLRVVDSEKVKMKFLNNLSPSIMKPMDHDNYKYLILPVRISE